MKTIVSAAIAVLVAGSTATAVQAQTVLRFNLWVPPTHHTHTKMMMPWAADVERVTEGRVKVEFTPSSLGAPPRQFDLAVEGIADVTFGDHAYTPGRFYLTKMAELPFLGESAEALSVAHWRTYGASEDAAKEHNGTKLLAVFMHGPAGIMTTRAKVDSLAALRGLKIRVPGEAASHIIKTLGGVPVSVPATQVFELLSQGVVDGSVYNIDAYKNFRLDRFMKFVTTVPNGLYNVSFFLVMNQKKWDSLSKADQAAIEKVSGEVFARRAGRTWDEEDKLSIELMKKNDVQITQASPQFLADIQAKLGDLRAEWVSGANKRGADGNKLFQKFKQEYDGLAK